ncbi:SH3 domain-containing protein [Peribacillus glennii]|uniref:SH3 domain-containing protein n=2 Tax=Peribacillus glennii TaxID=2303991 RepID=A0A372L8R4_9BACI|nr:SH3 domain-containing protein [Peribacillus glennii]
MMLSILVPFSSKTEAATLSATVTAAKLNVRDKPSTAKSTKILGTLKKGTKVVVYSKTSNGWSEIRYKGKKAYVSSKYLSSNSNEHWIGNYYFERNDKGGKWRLWMTIKNQKNGKFDYYLKSEYYQKANGMYYVEDYFGTANYKGVTASSNKLNGNPSDNKTKISFNKNNSTIKISINKKTYYNQFEGTYKKTK